MRQNYNQQTKTYGGQLVFPSTTQYPHQLIIPLYISTIDVPIRKQKWTEISTIPTEDEGTVSDWTTLVAFSGGQGILTTTFSGFFLTPTRLTADGISHIKYQQYDPTGDGSLLGYSYGDLIWLYIEGKLNQTSANLFLRTDPSYYKDPSGNVYNNVLIQQFQCDNTPATEKQTFSMTLYLEI